MDSLFIGQQGVCAGAWSEQAEQEEADGGPERHDVWCSLSSLRGAADVIEWGQIGRVAVAVWRENEVE